MRPSSSGIPSHSQVISTDSRFSAMMQRVLNARYQLARISSALEDALGSFQAPPVDFTSQNKQDPPPASAMSKAYSRFTERLNQPLTTTMYIAGPHMAPALNKAAMKNKDAVEVMHGSMILHLYNGQLGWDCMIVRHRFPQSGQSLHCHSTPTRCNTVSLQ